MDKNGKIHDISHYMSEEYQKARKKEMNHEANQFRLSDWRKWATPPAPAPSKLVLYYLSRISDNQSF